MDEQYINEEAQTPPPVGRPVYAQPSYAAHQPAYPVQPQRQRKQGKGYIVGIVAIIAICAVMMFAIASCTSTVNTAFEGAGLIDKAPSKPDGSPKVGVINMGGTIQYDGTSCSPDGLKALLDEAEGRSDIKAVVLVVNSGGGTATAGEEMANHVRSFEKPIIVCSDTVNASAAYEISSQADYIFTAKTSAIGSIGVSLEVTDLSGLYEMLGIKVENITSADSKDATYGNRPLTDFEREWYQAMVDQISDDFIATVAEGRNMSEEKVRELANGMTYTGIDAVEVGLCDEIGYFKDAVAYASKAAGASDTLDTTTLTLSSPSSLSDLIDLIGSSKYNGNDALDPLLGRIGRTEGEN